MTPSKLHRTIDSPPPDILFFPFSEGCVLFRKGTRRIWALNQTAAVFWCLLDELHTVEDLAQRVADTYGVAYQTALIDAGAITDFFMQEGLLGHTPPKEIFESDTLTSLGISVEGPDLCAVRRFFNLSGHILEVTSLDTVSADLYVNLMGHFECHKVDKPESTIWVNHSEQTNQWNIALNSELFFENLTPEEILPHLFLLTFSRATLAQQDRLLFHGAVLAKEGRAVILPAEMGSGKTTLAALLAHKGFTFVSDELTVLDRGETVRVFPLPLPMSIKPGSVPILTDKYPELPSAPVFPRPDGKKVRYLLPPQHALAGRDESFTVSALVFPSYGPCKSTEMQAMDKIQALNRLAATGSSERPLTAEDIRTMISLVEQASCYSLDFSDATEAVGIFDQKIKLNYYSND